MARKKLEATWRALGLMTNIGITLAVSVLIGYYAGHYLDRWILHKKDSWFTIVFSLFGVGAGFRGVFRLLNQALREEGKE